MTEGNKDDLNGNLTLQKAWWIIKLSGCPDIQSTIESKSIEDFDPKAIFLVG